MTQVVSLIAAVSRNGVIGRQGGLPWRLRDDMAYFAQMTMGKPVIMGRKTYESIPAKFRPLQGRRNIVVTRSRTWRDSGVETAGNLQEALKLAGDGEVMVAGGGEIYELAMKVAHKLYLTEIAATVDGDVRFPDVQQARWAEVSRAHHTEGEWNYDWVVYDRI